MNPLATRDQERFQKAKELALAARSDARSDTTAGMIALTLSFPSMEHAEGTAPFQPFELARWAQGRSHGELCTVRFLLSVWNPSDARRRVFYLEPFDLHEALEVWDGAHRGAFAGWAEDPWWP